MAPFFVSDAVKNKLKNKHHLTVEEVREAFFNLEGAFAKEEREENLGNNPRYWFISRSDSGRTIKIVLAEEEGSYFLVTAYEPDDEEVQSYERF